MPNNSTPGEREFNRQSVPYDEIQRKNKVGGDMMSSLRWEGEEGDKAVAARKT